MLNSIFHFYSFCVIITQKELSEKTNISLRTVKRIIQQLKEKNIIERVGSDRKGYLKINK